MKLAQVDPFQNFWFTSSFFLSKVGRSDFAKVKT